ncbi:hypothetical protein PVAP13_3KG207852 [Panicum virgatum]|uniref:WRKY19-like zinc finger domain-containing protein n=1 Tax=Panicum virgatum TaxID=38727 RepID=A0A8T0UTS1_PANVG|nr:hypothetical protein PVAP13_3KG207852 [Panicum virgatum]
MDRASPNLGSGSNINSLNNLCHWSTVEQAVENQDTAIDILLDSNFSKDNPRALKRKWIDMAGVEVPENPLLTLGLGRSPSSSENSKVSSPTACIMSPSSVKETDEESSMDLGLNFNLCLGHDMVHHHKKPHAGAEHMPSARAPKLDLQLSLSTCSPESAVTNASTASLDVHHGLETVVPNSVTDTIGRKSEPSSWVFGHYMASSSYASEATYSFSLGKIPQKVDDAVPSPDVSSAITASVKSPAACTSGATNPLKRNTNTKCCQFPGCEKGARGASGYCITHGGGRRCQKPGCQKGAEGKTIYCKAHGGGRRCQYLGCTKSAEGRTDHCIAHGGGRRCSQEGCSRAARGKSGLCIKHGGGKRCQRENCKRSAEGYSGLCISHGGGRRCQFPDCTKGAQGSTKFCKAHGGGKRCSWGQEGSSFGVGEAPCDKFARSKIGLCAAHSALIEDHCVHGGGSLGPAIKQFTTDAKPDEMKIAATKGDVDMANGGDEDIMVWGDHVNPTDRGTTPFPEGRVHGSGLLALFSGRSASASGAENGASTSASMRSWM